MVEEREAAVVIGGGCPGTGHRWEEEEWAGRKALRRREGGREDGRWGGKGREIVGGYGCGPRQGTAHMVDHYSEGVDGDFREKDLGG